MSETRVGEPKPLGPDAKLRKVTRNRKNYGQIVQHGQLVDGRKLTIYWSKRSMDQYHRLTEGWLFEADTISAIKLYGVTHVGLELETGEKLLTRIAIFGPEGEEQGVEKKRSNTYVDPWGRRGALCWHVPERLFAKTELTEEEASTALAAKMHVKRDRSRKSIEDALMFSKS